MGQHLVVRARSVEWFQGVGDLEVQQADRQAGKLKRSKCRGAANALTS